MNHLRILYFVITFLCVPFVNGNHDNCTVAFNSFSNRIGAFVGCYVEKGVPFTVCNDCVQHYTEAYAFYLAVIADSACSAKYINSNHYNTLQSIYNEATTLWAHAFCDDCFDWDDKRSTSNKSATNIEFFELSEELNKCFTSNKDVCENCAVGYENLNHYYNNITNHNPTKVCFDIQDKINQTRQMWSGKYKCCKDRRTSQLAFVITSSCLGMLPIIFYLSFIVYARKEEQRIMLTESEVNVNTSGHNSDTQTLVHSDTLTTAEEPLSNRYQNILQPSSNNLI